MYAKILKHRLGVMVLWGLVA